MTRASAVVIAMLLAAAPSGAAGAGDWLTRVSRDAPAVKARDAAWTAVVAVLPQPMGAAAAHRDENFRPAAGPRLTGHGHALSGIASYYWQEQMTATGERFDKRAFTAAHKTLPFGTRVKVTRLDTGSSVIVRINDRGPYKPGRIIDLSERAAEEIGMTARGVTPVKLEVLGK